MISSSINLFVCNNIKSANTNTYKEWINKQYKEWIYKLDIKSGYVTQYTMSKKVPTHEIPSFSMASEEDMNI